MSDHTTVAGTAGGTLLSIWAIPTQTIVATIALAAIGAIVSFGVSLLLKELVKYFKKK